MPDAIPGAPPSRPATVAAHVDGLGRLLIRDPGRSVLVRVRGESMRGAGIRHGDLLVIERQRQALAGQVVVALVQGGLTLKRLVRRHGRWWLEAAHPDYPALELGTGRLWGVVIHRIRMLLPPGPHPTLSGPPAGPEAMEGRR